MLKLYDTLVHEVRPFKAADKKKALVYVCGITPYDYCHLGHGRTLVAFDVLRRWIEHSGTSVMHIQNVTDIDDKIIKRAQEKKRKPLELSAEFDERSREDMKALGLLPPTVMCKISEHIPQTIALIEKIMENGCAYATSTGVYFEIPKFPAYGKLSGQKLDKIRSGARVEVDEEKRHPEDFALWKLDGKGCAHEPATGACVRCATSPSPWGRGRPGWHIECSAMSLHYTGGRPLDLHGGARDLIFPHHENEIAQSEAAGVKPFSRHWTHTGFLTVEGEKMAKSLGNFITIRDALKSWDAMTLRLFFGLTHYRSPVDFSATALAGAKTTLENVRRSLSVMEGEGAKVGDAHAEKALHESIEKSLADFALHMDNDLDTSQAIASLIAASKELARARSENLCSRKSMEKEAGRISDAFSILGIEWGAGAGANAKEAQMDKSEIETLIEARQAARAKKDFKTADAIRKQLSDAGVILEDSKDGAQKWRYA